jgi:hypothetical protein
MNSFNGISMVIALAYMHKLTCNACFMGVKLTCLFSSPTSMTKLTESTAQNMSSPWLVERKTLRHLVVTVPILPVPSPRREGVRPRPGHKTTGTSSPRSAPSLVPSLWRIARAQTTSCGEGQHSVRQHHTTCPVWLLASNAPKVMGSLPAGITRLKTVQH